jgi:hypothetical protein
MALEVSLTPFFRPSADTRKSADTLSHDRCMFGLLKEPLKQPLHKANRKGTEVITGHEIMLLTSVGNSWRKGGKN